MSRKGDIERHYKVMRHALEEERNCGLLTEAQYRERADALWREAFGTSQAKPERRKS